METLEETVEVSITPDYLQQYVPQLVEIGLNRKQAHFAIGILGIAMQEGFKVQTYINIVDTMLRMQNGFQRIQGKFRGIKIDLSGANSRVHGWKEEVGQKGWKLRGLCLGTFSYKAGPLERYYAHKLVFIFGGIPIGNDEIYVAIRDWQNDDPDKRARSNWVLVDDMFGSDQRASSISGKPFSQTKRVLVEALEFIIKSHNPGTYDAGDRLMKEFQGLFRRELRFIHLRRSFMKMLGSRPSY